MTKLWGCRLFTGLAEETIEFGLLELQEGKIVAAEPLPKDTPVPEFDEACIDGRGYTALPGLIDCEAYLSMDAGPDALHRRKEALDAKIMFWAIENGRKYLRRGFTTVRDAGDKNYETLVLRNAIKEGRLIGPQVLCSGAFLRASSGYGVTGHEISGVDGAYLAIRKHFCYQVDWVKLNVSSNCPPRFGKALDYEQLLPDEIRGVMTIAGNYKKRVAAHAQCEQAILDSLAEGVICISHGAELTDQAIEALLKHDAWLVPAFSPYVRALEAPAGAIPESTRRFAEAVMAIKEKGFQKAVAAGVKIAYGSGAGMDLVQPADVSFELSCMVRAGMTPEKALESVTSQAAAMLGKDNRIGYLRAGYAGDVLVVKGNPLEDMNALSDTAWVFQGGKLIATAEGLEDVALRPVYGD